MRLPVLGRLGGVDLTIFNKAAKTESQ